jgi:hypothetical protein
MLVYWNLNLLLLTSILILASRASRYDSQVNDNKLTSHDTCTILIRRIGLNISFDSLSRLQFTFDKQGTRLNSNLWSLERPTGERFGAKLASRCARMPRLNSQPTSERTCEYHYNGIP